MNILIRTDGSTQLGLGHIIRSLALAKGIGATGVKSIFVTRDYEQRVAEIIRHHEYSVETIPQSCSFREDLLLTSELSNQYKARLVVTDLCNVNILANLGEYGKYLKGLKDKGNFLVTIDDINEMTFPSDIVINPNYGAENMSYEFGTGTKFLLGPAYFIFGQEFIEVAKIDREIVRNAQNILVTMGGSDLLRLTPKIARALTELGETANLNLRIVLGIDYTNEEREELKEILKDFTGTYELIQRSYNLAESMVWSDLALTGGGLTKYETAVTGTPSIIISQIAHQADLVKEFEKEGTTLNLGLGTKISEEDLAGAVRRLLKDDTLRAEMSGRGKRLVDGKGIERILSQIPREVFS